MPEIPFHPPIEDLFANLHHNWGTLTPVLSVLFGILFAAFVAGKLIKMFKGDDD